MTTPPLVRLYDSLGLGLIILAPTGVRYSNQVGGHSCLQPAVEGLFVPLRNDLGLAPVTLLGPEPELTAYFTGSKHGGSGATSGLDRSDADVITRILANHRLDTVLQVAIDRLADSCEAWVHVRVLADDLEPSPVFSGFGPYPRAGILTWGNSD
jgi:hypothetical protein